MQKSSLRCYLAAITGNILEHYDGALYGFAAPFIAPLFLGHRDQLSALILIYAIPLIGFAARPLGSLFFGWIGDQKGRKQALFCSILGLSLTTVAIGLLPTYHQIGNSAFVGLACIKTIQNFCLAGETAGGAIFVLEHTEAKKRSLMSSLYSVSTIIGIMLASALCLLFSQLGIMEKGWRILFYFGGVAAIIGFVIRFKTKESSEFLSRAQRTHTTPFLQTALTHLKTVLALTFASGFSYITYSFAFVFMNVYIPLMTSVTQSKALEINTSLLFLDLILLPLFGYLAMKIGKEKVMLMGAGALALLGVPLFCFLAGASLSMVILVRVIIVIFGVAFAAPYYAWAIERVSLEHRFTLLSLANALAYHFGQPTTAICLWLHKKSTFIFAPGMYLSLVAMIAVLVVRLLAKYPAKTPAQPKISFGSTQG